MLVVDDAGALVGALHMHDLFRAQGRSDGAPRDRDAESLQRAQAHPAR